MRNLRLPAVALLVDPDPVTASVYEDVLASVGFKAVRATTAAEALERFHAASPTLVLLDIALPDMPGRQLLRHLRAEGTGATTIVAVATMPDIRTVVDVTRAGANEVLDKSAEADEVVRVLTSALATPEKPEGARPAAHNERDRINFFGQYDELFRRSDGMREIEKIVLQVADTNATVLVQGETGVGKELVAKALHYLSDRSSRPWVKVNCASLPAELLESELFGHEKGAFTGAAARKPGRFEVADGGTLLLDEIGEMPVSLQSKILHVLQDNEFFRVGGRELISVDVRIIAATNKDIFAMVQSGAFREDLYYRLNVLNILVPPLRDRREEIPSLIEYYRHRFARQFNRRTAQLSVKTLELLCAYQWPGNVRELENLVKRYVALGDEEHLRHEVELRMKNVRLEAAPRPLVPPSDMVPTPERRPTSPPTAGIGGGAGLRDIARRAAEEAERSAILEVLELVQWNRAEAARRLKINYKTLLTKLSQAGLAGKPRGSRRH